MKESTSFLKKRSKKLLKIGCRASQTPELKDQKFFGSFFQKRTCFLPSYLCAALTLAPCAAKADLLFNGQWENYDSRFYGPDGWRNGTQLGHKTGAGDWTDTVAFWTPAPADNSWLYNMSWAPDRIRLVLDPSSPKRGMVARFEVRAGDHRDGYHSGERSEMYGMLGLDHKKLPVTASSGHEFYGVSVKVGADWKPPQPEPPSKGRVMWGTFMQLHSPNVYDSPPALDFMAESSFHLDMDAGDLDQLVRDPKTGQLKHVKKPSEPIAFSNGSLRPGHWVQFVLDVVWATDERGALSIYRRDEGQTGFTRVLDIRGRPTLQTDSNISTDPAQCSRCAPDNVTHYWRVGFYRSTSNDQTNVLWLGPVVRGTSFDEVAAAAFGSSRLR